MSEPTPAELVRRIDDLTRTLERLTSTLENSYVRKELYEANHRALRREYEAWLREIQGDVSDLQEGQKAQIAFRRQILGGVIVGVVLIVAQIILVLTRIPGGGA